MKDHLLILLCIVVIPGIATSQEAFITTWQTDKIGIQGVSKDISFFVEGNDLEIVWGDGEVDNGIGSEVVTHEYPYAGTYTVEIRGQLNRFIGHGGNLGPKLMTIEQWGDSKWTSMHKAFFVCTNLKINAIDAPDLSEATDLSSMFELATNINESINHWDVSGVVNMSRMFYGAKSFDQSLSNWDVSSCTDMSYMFSGAKAFNKPLGGWRINNVKHINYMFSNAQSFNQDIGSWEMSHITDLSNMFSGAKAFNQDIGNWNVSNVTNMSVLFWRATSFNQDISKWNVSKVTDMSVMFHEAHAFNQDISDWDISNVKDMSAMFKWAENFNQDIGNWDVSNVTRMDNLFDGATSFNKDIGSWDVSKVYDMSAMFYNATSFNQDLSSWDVSNVQDMHYMFKNAIAFNQNLGEWEVLNVKMMTNMLDLSGIDYVNYDSTLYGWSSKSIGDSIELGVEGISYCNDLYRQHLIDEFSWRIVGDHQFQGIKVESNVVDTSAYCEILYLKPPVGSVCNSDTMILAKTETSFPIKKSTVITWLLEYGNSSKEITQDVTIQEDELQCFPLSSKDQDHPNVYPNPFDDILNLDSSVERICMIDCLGRTVENVKKIDDKMEVSHLKPGIYFLYLFRREGVERHRIVKTE